MGDIAEPPTPAEMRGVARWTLLNGAICAAALGGFAWYVWRFFPVFPFRTVAAAAGMMAPVSLAAGVLACAVWEGRADGAERAAYENGGGRDV